MFYLGSWKVFEFIILRLHTRRKCELLIDYSLSDCTELMKLLKLSLPDNWRCIVQVQYFCVWMTLHAFVTLTVS